MGWRHHGMMSHLMHIGTKRYGLARLIKLVLLLPVAVLLVAQNSKGLALLFTLFSRRCVVLVVLQTLSCVEVIHVEARAWTGPTMFS